MNTTPVTDQVLLDFSNWIKSSEVFLQKEIPPTLQQYLTSIIISDVSIIALSIILWTVIVVLFRKSQTAYKKSSYGPEFFWDTPEITYWQALRIISFVMIIITSIITITSAWPAMIELVKCYFTPRIVLIEHISHLLR